MVFINLAKITAPSNSNLGIVCLFIGAILVFEDTSMLSIEPSVYTFRKYITAAYAFSDASENPCN